MKKDKTSWTDSTKTRLRSENQGVVSDSSNHQKEEKQESKT
mgnify:CR=1 FL=1